MLIFKIDKDLLECDLIIKSIELAVTIYFSEKSKQDCLNLNKDGSNINDIIDEFRSKRPIIQFKAEYEKNVISGRFNDNMVNFFI